MVLRTTQKAAGTTETESAGTTESESAGTTEALPGKSSSNMLWKKDMLVRRRVLPTEKKQEHPAKNTNPCQTGAPSLKLTVHRFTPEYMIGRIPKGKEMNHQGAVNSLFFFRFREDVTTNPCQWKNQKGACGLGISAMANGQAT